MPLKALYALLLLATTCSAFQTPVVTSRGIRPMSTTTSMSVLPLESFQEIHSLVSDSTQAWSQLLTDPSTDVHSLLDSTSLQLLADATEAVTKDDGWWAAYLNIFKTCLLFVHNTIDAPLRSVGVTQTWGIAIAIFTACEFYVRSFMT